ncbi:MAG: cupin domain-containing protein [Rhodospirillaceae bacterium]|nr:cupin domain-containing protein [Rhodospirillaceae bacterium]
MTSNASFSDRVKGRSAVPLWEIFSDVVFPNPRPLLDPRHWKYTDLRPLLMESLDAVAIEDAERRVLILSNTPGHGITHSLFCGFQVVGPGETARCHRHTQAAVRFVVEGGNAFPAVDGERLYMSRGDFITTPSWTWHEHTNNDETPLIWLDGLDVPLSNFMQATFAEVHPAGNQEILRPDDDSVRRYGAGMLPIEEVPGHQHSPVYKYPYDQCRATLEALRKGPIDPAHGHIMKYADPRNGGHVMPTLAAYLQLLPEEFTGEALRNTASQVFFVVEGQGRTEIGDETFEWSANDVFVVPNWVWFSHSADNDAVLFSYSDRAALENLGLWRETRQWNPA